MASIEEVEGWISDGTYPHVARTSDPLIVRVSRFSLLVNDTNFYAKVKNGLGYKGYLIYSSGLGTPILEESATNETEFLNNDTFKKFISESGRNTDKLYEDTANMQVFLQDAAKSWLDTLELEIVKQPNDNAIKKAIDRLCWQLHYDITESHTDFATVFKDNDFANVQIDRYPMETEYWDGITLTTAISDSAGVTYKKDYGTDKCTVTIKDKGYLKDFDDHLTTGTYKTEVEDDKTVVTEGSLMTVFDEHLLGGMYSDSDGAIKTFDDHLMLGLYNDTKGAITLFDEHFRKFDDHLTLDSYNESQGAIKTFDNHLLKGYYDSSDGAFKKFNAALNDANDGSLIKIGTKLVPDDTDTKQYYSISECLREYSTSGEHGFTTYSIARSLREDIGSVTQTSVSQATHDQTELEEDKFTEISETKLGDFGSTGHKTLYATLGEYVDNTKNSLSQAIGYTTVNISVDKALGVTPGDQKDIASRLGTWTSGDVNNAINTITDRIGTPLKLDGQGNLSDGTESLFNAVYSHAGTLNYGRGGWTSYYQLNTNSVFSGLWQKIDSI